MNMATPDDAALDALAAALAPRLLREVRALLAAEADDDCALGIAALASIGYVPAPGAGTGARPHSAPAPRGRGGRKPNR